MYEIKSLISKKKKRSKVKQKMKMILKWLCFVTIFLLLLVATTIGKSFANIYTTNVEEPNNNNNSTVLAQKTNNNKNNISIYKNVMLDADKIKLNQNLIQDQQKLSNEKQKIVTGLDPPKFSFLQSAAKLQQQQIPSLSSYTSSSSSSSLLSLPSSISSSVSNYNTNITYINDGSSSSSSSSPYNFGISDLAKAMDKKLKNIRNVELGASVVQDIYDSMEFSAVARNDVETVNKMSKKLNAKLKKTSNIINDVCNFIETEAPKITRNSCNKFNTFVTPCPATAAILSNNIASGWQQQQQQQQHYDGNSQNFVVATKTNPLFFDPLTASTTTTTTNNFANNNNNNLNANHKMDILNYLNLTSGSNNIANINNNNNNKIDYNNLASGINGGATIGGSGGIILNQGKIIMRNNHDNNNDDADDDEEDDESDLFGEDENNINNKNVLNNKLQNFITKRFNDEMNRNNNVQQLLKQPQFINMLNVKQHYFLSKYDQLTDNKCQYYFDDTHLRSLYISPIKNKHVLLLIDHGNSVSNDQIKLTKSLVKSIVQLLSSHDKIGIIAVSNKILLFKNEEFAKQYTSNNSNIANNTKNTDNNNTSSSNSTSQTGGEGGGGRIGGNVNINDDNIISDISALNFYSATQMTKKRIIDFIESLNQTKEATNHPLGFKYAFALLKQLYMQKNVNDVGKLQQQQQQANMQKQELPITFLYQFLNDVISQNYTKYGITVPTWLTLRKSEGKLYSLTDVSDINLISLALFTEYYEKNVSIDQNLMIHSPIVDAYSKDMIIPNTRACGNIGVFGMDLYLGDLAEDITYYTSYNDSYAFMIDISGKTLAHPSFPRPIMTKEEFFPIDISYLENVDGFAAIRREMLQKEAGVLTIGGNNNNNNNNKTYKYTWQRVAEFYIICIVSFSMKSEKPVLMGKIEKYSVDHTDNGLHDLLYHRLDLLPPLQPKSMCRYIKQLATFDAETLYLSSAAFQSPFSHLRINREGDVESNIQTIRAIMAYIRDVTDEIVNPGLRDDIKNDVLASLRVMTYLKRMHVNADTMKKYIIRRYVSTVNGVLQVYPGCLLESEFEATRRPWFLKAMEHPGRLVITEPYLDAGGAGYVVTVAYTIFQGRSDGQQFTTSSSSSERQTPMAVIALDFTQGFFYKLLLDASHLCGNNNIKCFLMDDKGYLIAHPDIILPAINNNRLLSEHLTAKESQVASDILNHERFVSKRLCNNYINRTVQRYYQFNISHTDIVTNLVQGEKTKYQIMLIPNTNIFIGIVNSSYDTGAFCPCSTVDRLCLNCNRMEQSECECPCECPLDVFEEKISLNSIESNSNSSSCRQYPEHLTSYTALAQGDEIEMQSCLTVSCDIYSSQYDCLGVLGCEWCQVDVDGESLLTTPFCTSSITCFNGVLGSSDPYGEPILGTTLVDPSIFSPGYSAVGSFAGAIMILCLIIALAMYCYRNTVDQTVINGHHLYGDSLQDNCGMPLSRFDYDDMSPDDCEMNNIRQNLLLHQTNNAVILPNLSSPYRVVSNYRRTNGGGESDLGYSTMTPQDDSEHLYISSGIDYPSVHNHNNSNSRHNNYNMSTSDLASINTSISSSYFPSTKFSNNYEYQQVPTTTQTQNTSSIGVISHQNKHNYHHSNNTSCNNTFNNLSNNSCSKPNSPLFCDTRLPLCSSPTTTLANQSKLKLK
uniref:CSON014583 protein n=1 Tax=Culicoides sonorensis TaxID=179676 RepID=A0A336KQQ9_CULSO